MNPSTPPALPALVDRGGPAQPLLLVRELRKHFAVRGGLFERSTQQVRAVDGVSFSVAKGETLGIVGASGCGKSTTARLIARLLPADSGEMVFDGDGVGQFGGMALKEFRRNLQMVFQDSFASLNPRLTAIEAVAYGPQVHGLTRAAALARAGLLLARVGLAPEQFGSRYPHELSGGQRQRVNIARALAFEPRLLILDEAVAALDKSVQAQVLNLLQELKAERGLTYLFISHDLPVVHYLADRVLVMYLGQVVEMGPVERLYGQPRHPYTRALLSAVPSMNPAQRTELSPLAGDPPNPINPPSGCRFRDRCAHAHAACAVVAPVLRETTAGHWAACHLNDTNSGHPEAPARAMIALALACRPKLLLADEPTTALDATVQIQILLLRELQRETGMSVIFVTHDIGAAIEAADRIAVIYAGRIVEENTVAGIVATPRHPYSAGLLASTVSAAHRGQKVPTIGGAPPDLSALPPGCAFSARCDFASARCHAEQPALQRDAAGALACWNPVPGRSETPALNDVV